MAKKLEDIEAACNLIKQARKYNKTLIKKGIYTPLQIDDIRLKNKVILVCNPATGITSVSCKGIGYKNISIYPTTHKKLKCTNQSAIDKLQRKREINRKRIEKRRKELRV